MAACMFAATGAFANGALVEFERAEGALPASERLVPLQALSSTLTAMTIVGKNLVLFIVFSINPAFNAGTNKGLSQALVYPNKMTDG